MFLSLLPKQTFYHVTAALVLPPPGLCTFRRLTCSLGDGCVTASASGELGAVAGAAHLIGISAPR